MPPPSTRPPFLTRHGVVPLYVPNLIGEQGLERGESGCVVRDRACAAVECVGQKGGGRRRPLSFRRHGQTPVAKNGALTRSRLVHPSPHTGYARIACAAYAFSVALTNPVQCIVFYFIG